MHGRAWQKKPFGTAHQTSATIEVFLCPSGEAKSVRWLTTRFRILPGVNR
jgi:hypothetical protein